MAEISVNDISCAKDFDLPQKKFDNSLGEIINWVTRKLLDADPDKVMLLQSGRKYGNNTGWP